MFDSDTMLLTDNEVLIRCASKHYNIFKVPTMVMESQKRKRKYTNTDKASLDIFCDSDRIGVTVNLSQELNTIMWEKINRYGDWEGAMSAYYDNCLLSILSMIEIDSAKKEYPLDCMEELQIVRSKYDERDEDGRAVRPNFFAHVAKKKGYYDPKKKNYKRQMAPMDYVQEIIDLKKRYKNRTRHERPLDVKGLCSIGDILKEIDVGQKPRKGYVDIVLSMVRTMDNKTRMIYQSDNDVASAIEKRRLAAKYFEGCINGIKAMRLNDATMRDLLVAIDDKKNSDIKRKLWNILFGAFGDKMARLLVHAKEPIYTIEECGSGDNGDTRVYWLRFRHVNAA